MAVDIKRRGYGYVYPFERIAAYAAIVAARYSDISQAKALDFGFGGGRHLKVLSDLGFECYGLDVNEDAIDTTYYNFGKDFIARDRLTIDNILEHEVYPDNYFDVILSVGVLWIRGYNQMIAFMDKLIPLIKADGYLIANFRTKFDDYYSSGEEISEGGKTVYVPRFENKWAFLDIDDLKEMANLYHLEIEKLERYERYYTKQRISYWEVILKKSS